MAEKHDNIVCLYFENFNSPRVSAKDKARNKKVKLLKRVVKTWCGPPVW